MSFHFQADEEVLGDVIGLKDSSTAFTPERDKRGTEEEKDIPDTRMGVGQNTTSKSMDSSSEGGKLEEESKHGVDSYPIPVIKRVIWMFIIL